jgi:hypothetical protein
MPNWCDNHLTLRHKDANKLEAAIEAFKENKLFQHFIPLPETGWDWNFCVENWGTKWESEYDESNLTMEGNTVRCTFLTAWSPPIGVYKAMCEQGFEVEAMYCEPGMCFVGRIVGDELDFNDDYYEYGSEDSNTVRELIGEELDDAFGISELMEEFERDRDEQDH